MERNEKGTVNCQFCSLEFVSQITCIDIAKSTEVIIRGSLGILIAYEYAMSMLLSGEDAREIDLNEE